ncbi:MAG: twin-arginine translocase subunit TatC [Pseudomonadota bacterium]
MSTTEQDEEKLDDEGKEQGFLSHLFELRDRLLRCVLAIILAFACLFPFANEVYTFFAGPLSDRLPEGTTMVSIGVVAPFLTPLKLVLVASVFVTVPYLLSQIWGFIAPGLYRSEKRLVVPLLVSSTLLFYIGVAFSYYVVAPLVFGFMVGTTPTGVAYSPDIASYLDFIITMFFAFGIAFEVPIAVILLVAIGVTTPESLASKRPYFIVAAFIIGMFLTPPDVISQTLLALPMWLLFEFGILFSRIMLRKKPKPTPGDGTMPLASQPVIMPPESATVVLNDDEEDDDEDEFEFLDDADSKPAKDTSDPDDTSHADAADVPYQPLSEDEMEAELDRHEHEGPAAETDEQDPGVDIDTDTRDDAMLDEEIEEELARIREEDASDDGTEADTSSVNEDAVIDQLAEDGIVEPLSEEEIATELERIKQELDEDSQQDKAEDSDKPRDK